MAVSPWGIEDGYKDALGTWQTTPDDTRAAIRHAMGADEPGLPLPRKDAVRVVWPGRRVGWPRGQLNLEDGATLSIVDALPADLPTGYHRFQAEPDGQETLVIASPGKCVLPKPTWGWAVQLYAARSQQSWGLGDLGDLRQLGRWAAGMGAGVLLVSPMCAAAYVADQDPSPYFPSSRLFLNPLYLRVEDVPGSRALGPELDRLAATGRALSERRLIDRREVFRLKDAALRQIFAGFRGDADFDAFCARRGATLARYAAYCVLAERFEPNWKKWPADYQEAESAKVRSYVASRAEGVRYYQWLQWLLDRQLAEASSAAPIVQDLPVGFDAGGADAWAWKSLLAERATVGAPPDVFNAAGQDWQLPPLVPHKLREAGYEPFVQTIRAGLRHSAGLRIDHVMGLFRLYWIPEGFGPARGAYVRYAHEELLAIVALESQRAGAFVVGEDLGTVEPGVRKAMARHNVLSFRLLWFESRATPKYPRLAMAATTTHDLPTVAGLWSGSELDQRAAQGLAPDEALAGLGRRLMRLVRLPAGAPLDDVIEATYRILSRAPSLVLLATLEDAMGVTERPNMPGTTQARNWSLALPGGLEAVESAALPRRIAEALRRNNET